MESIEERRKLMLDEFLKLNPKDLFQKGEVNIDNLVGMINLFREIARSYKICPFDYNKDVETYRVLKVDSPTLTNIEVKIPYSENEILFLEDFYSRDINGISFHNGKMLSARPLDSIEDAQEYTGMLQEIVAIKTGGEHSEINAKASGDHL